ncbi:hypothetical protein PN450_13370 [Dolichospermum lemmermannii CS-548]|uniref:hypothetical protein n=1 Tax=Dolichospermum lemmermannii TaxID=54295 RepID=UPI00232D3DFD|nr:hypothetical protein [Dolichospermum lemmermannii]MDB9437762.1 hypothetical protein [Dolichospermum lemmermannii CS-548]
MSAEYGFNEYGFNEPRSRSAPQGRSEGSEGRKEEEEKKKKVGNFQLGKGVKISNLKF